jgi:dTDP-4-dehydrorhamnose reductase
VGGNEEMKFLILGATGMAGHTIAIYLKEQGHAVRVFTRKPFPYAEEIRGEVSDFETLREIIQKDNYDAVINCVGILNQDAERNKYLAVLLNSALPHFLSKITSEMTTRVIHMSTDCVFSGKKGNYTEDSFRDGETFYDRTKALGELENEKDLTFRNSIVGPDMKPEGIGLFNWFMKQHSPIKGYSRAMWTGVTTLTLAKAMERAAEDGLTGLYNLVNNRTISKFDLLRLFNDYFKKNKIPIEPDEHLVVDKSLVNSRTDFSFHVPSYELMIQEMKTWVDSHRELYPHYFEDRKEKGAEI